MGTPVQYNAFEELNILRDHGVANHFTKSINDEVVLDIKFQKGGTATTERNGIFIEDLLVVAYAKLDEYNKHLPSRENSLALTKIEESLHWLTARKAEREYRNVYGTEEK